MRDVVVTEFMTLDGVIEAPDQWSFPFWNDEIAKFKTDELFACDAMLLGRVTYDGFAAAWPGRTDEQGYADRFNNLPKYVVSNTLKEATWNNSHIVRGYDLANEITRLKQQPGQDILIHGSGTLVRALMQKGLIDRYNLLVYPIVRGKGKRLFPEDSQANLQLVETCPTPSGVVLLRYQVNSKEL